MPETRTVILRPEPRRDAYQFFMDWFYEAWVETGGAAQPNLGLPWCCRLAAAKVRLAFRIVRLPRQPRLLVLCGGYPDSFVWPFSHWREVVPLIWDCWPRYWPRLLASLQRNRIRTAFFTSSQVARMVGEQLPHIRSVWIPEGISTAAYPTGVSLAERSVDVLEMGRLHPEYHRHLFQATSRFTFVHQFQTPGAGLLLPDFASLTRGLCNSKICICFPRCDTNPAHAGNIETLTQRYWECMLSGTLMLGRAPRELVDLLGFNPVIDVSWSRPEEQLREVLANINQYQGQVEACRAAALRIADWRNRMPLIRGTLQLI